MKKIYFIIVFISILSFSFAQMTFGISAQQYYLKDENGRLPGFGQAFSDFADGQGVYWGFFGEYIYRGFGLGLSFNNQYYADSQNRWLDTWNYDLNFFVSYHFLGGDFIVDPFVQAGFGIWSFDYVDTEGAKRVLHGYNGDPLAISTYLDLGLGCGVNLGMFGLFFKAMWNFQSNAPLYSNETGYVLWELPVMPFKWVLGAKILLF
jgi:hypothetical protein